ncbi:phytanoyl-CoA dioxygenase family protein [Streptomyces sp. NPDC006984]|uniref:phytanoyl-CoA dioxygenase family protein n=1 Tax=Streptomyces sp. NPDC006984 TaxID=3155463 RepID=UPI0033E9593F
MPHHPHTDPAIAPAPPGFTEDSWAAFARDGILVVEDALEPATAAALSDAVAAQAENNRGHIVGDDARFTALIDHPAHVGHVYDVYGEMLKLLRSEYVRRAPGGAVRNAWHFDGPRLLPFSAFARSAPLRIKVGYWLTPLPRPAMGNLVYVPGSHHWDHLPQYHTHEPHPQERRLIVRPGAMTLMWGGLWHRVDTNGSDVTRHNVFLEYGPSWLVTSDRLLADPQWAETLPRAQRIIMRAYREQNQCVKPPSRDVPLFLPRPGEPVEAKQPYADHVPSALRKRPTWLERRIWA